MKAWFRIVFLCLLTLPALAQQDEDELPQTPDPKVKEKIQAARIAYLTNQLGLTPEEAEKFWPIYHEFTQKRQELKRELREARKNPTPGKSAEENDRALVDLGLKVKQKELDLEKDYSGKLLKVISAQKLRALPDAEKNFRQMILDQIQRRQHQQQKREMLRDRTQQRLQQRNN